MMESLPGAIPIVTDRLAQVTHPVIRQVAGLLAAQPSLSCTQIARDMNLSYSWLARTFKRELKMSIVDYRNEIRMAEFLGRPGVRAGNMQKAAFDAGFGSYAQFCRVFRARYGHSARAYLKSRKAAGAAPVSPERPPLVEACAE
jgi:AraC-like DNA-binding protein